MSKIFGGFLTLSGSGGYVNVIATELLLCTVFTPYLESMGNVVNTAHSICSSAANGLGNALRAAGKAISRYWQRFSSWISQPHIYGRIFVSLGIAGAILLMVPLSVTALGFGPAGIIAGSAAAGIQSGFYGGFVPAGGLFAGLTSAGMTRALVELAAVPATIAAASSLALRHDRHTED